MQITPTTKVRGSVIAMSPKETTAVLKRMPETLQKHVAGLMEAQLRFQPEGGYFSVLENVYRLRGIEIEGYGVRLQHLLVEEHLPEKSAD